MSKMRNADERRSMSGMRIPGDGDQGNVQSRYSGYESSLQGLFLLQSDPLIALILGERVLQ